MEGVVGDVVPSLPDTLAGIGIDSIGHIAADSMAVRTDSAGVKRGAFGVDSTFFTVRDSVKGSRIRRTKADLDNQVIFSSKDSMIMVGREMTYMYGDGQIDYGDLKLTAEDIELDMAKSEVYAVGVEDSLGEVKGSPGLRGGRDRLRVRNDALQFQEQARIYHQRHHPAG